MKLTLRLIVLLAALQPAHQALAQNAHPGPAVPQALRSPAPHTPASGQALQGQALQKLKRRFDEADLDRDGSLTRDEARRAGLGFVDNSFDQIDGARRGRVSFDDVGTFMVARAKAARALQER